MKAALKNIHKLFLRSDYQVKSGVLQLTLGIALVISILCASIILFVYYNKLSFLSQEIQNKLRNNAHSGIQYVMAHKNEMPYNESRLVDLFEDETDSVELTRRPWGLFEMYDATAFQGNQKQIKTALITAMPSTIGKSALYSPDNNAPLYLVGDVLIEGTVYTSERKFSTGYIDGKGYTRKKLVEGEVKKSETTMPLLDTALLYEVKNLLKGDASAYKVKLLDRIPTDTILSFEENSLNYYYSDQSIDIEDSISGNMIIHSAIKIRVTAQAKLHDVIILAPDIDVDKGFSGSIQCFANRSIIIGAECKLDYPSSLVLLGGEQDSTIILKENSRVEGLVVIQGIDPALASKGVFRMKKGSVFHGMAYINGAADIQGSLWGHITSRSFQANVMEAIYGNYLVNGEINAVKRSVFMPGNLLWGNEKNLVIAKWLE